MEILFHSRSACDSGITSSCSISSIIDLVGFYDPVSYCGLSLQVWLLYVLYVSIGLFYAIDIKKCVAM